MASSKHDASPFRINLPINNFLNNEFGSRLHRRKGMNFSGKRFHPQTPLNPIINPNENNIPREKGLEKFDNQQSNPMQYAINQESQFWYPEGFHNLWKEGAKPPEGKSVHKGILKFNESLDCENLATNLGFESDGFHKEKELNLSPVVRNEKTGSLAPELLNVIQERASSPAEFNRTDEIKHQF
jgi:hypothetical protein